MKKRLIGAFKIDGKIIAIDPCYKDLKDGVLLKMKQGLYKAFVLNGKLKDSIFNWDKLNPQNSRNSKVIIQHELHKGEITLKSKGLISVDSGQAGFFNLNSYRKTLNQEIPLNNNAFDFLRESITSEYSKINKFKILLENQDSDKFKEFLKIHKNNKKELIKYLKEGIKYSLEEIEDCLKTQESKDYPDYLKEKDSDDFYEVMCDLSRGKFFAGVNSTLGVNSSSGYGDGSYSLKIGQNKNKENVYAEIEFLKKDLFKKGE